MTRWSTFAGQSKQLKVAMYIRWQLIEVLKCIRLFSPEKITLDHNLGGIRRKWVGNPGEKSIDAALKNLIQEAEDALAPK